MSSILAAVLTGAADEARHRFCASTELGSNRVADSPLAAGSAAVDDEGVLE